MMVNTGNFRRCFQGHFYKADLMECPYCPPIEQMQKIKNNGDNVDTKQELETFQLKYVQPHQQIKSVFLTVLKGEKPGSVMPIKERLLIGSRSNNHIVLKDPGVSPVHLVIQFNGYEVLVINCSKKEIMVNSTICTETCKLNNNDIISIGNTVFRVNME